MLTDKVHFLIKSLNACHIGFCIICKFYFLSAADALCAPVKVSHIHRASYLACDSVESCLPSLYWLACAFWCQSKVYNGSFLHFVDYAEGNVATSFSVYRYTAQFAEKPSEWAPEKLTLDHAVWLAAN